MDCSIRDKTLIHTQNVDYNMISEGTQVTIPKLLMKDLDGLPDKKQTGIVKKKLVRGKDIQYEVEFDNFNETRYIPEQYIFYK